MPSSIGTELYSQIATVINDNLFDLGISINDKKTEGNFIYLQCEHDRLETQDELEALLDKIPSIQFDRRKIPSRSSIDTTRYFRGSQEVKIVYKGKSGGMSSTTINASITELFPAIAFELGLPKNISLNDFYTKIYNEGVKLGKGGVYKNPTAMKAGQQVILNGKEQAGGLWNDKLKNAYDLFKYILDTYERKKIAKIVWGYRNNTKPNGVKPNHKGDIFLVFKDGKMIGLSIKATSGGAAPPQFNSYVQPIYRFFGKMDVYQKLMKESYDKFYSDMLGVPPFKNYKTPIMESFLDKYEKNSSTKTDYNRRYDNQLAWLKQKVMDLIKNNPDDAKEWLLREVCAEQESVPLIVLHATKGGVQKLDDEEEVKMCVQVSKKGKQGIKTESASGKQDFLVNLSCEKKTTKLKFSIRTNAVGAKHKLGQYINLAVKFNGIVK
tara:strand:- start:50 stop:1363 length:1314 start_codon:yes stop_codon:yes gene_type:complete